MTSRDKAVHVVAAVIEYEGRFLLALRPPGKSLAGHWEFPGGKVEPDEDPRSALYRELVEELAAGDVKVHEALCARPHDYEAVSVLIDAYRVTCDVNSLQALEHERIAWYTPEQMGTLPLAPADRFIVTLLAAKSC